MDDDVGYDDLHALLSPSPPGELDDMFPPNQADVGAVLTQLQAVNEESAQLRGVVHNSASSSSADGKQDEVLEQAGWFDTLAKKCVNQKFDASNVKPDVVGPLIRGLVSPLSLSHACCKHAPY
jgi:hypothetical protein